jgi:hypothetical protein
MAFLDFIKNRAQQAPEAKPAPTQAPVKEAPKAIEQALSKEALQTVKEVGERLQKATIQGPSTAPAGGDGSNAALRQNQNNQDKTQAAMSPTDRFNGQAATQKKSRGWER